MHVLVVTHLYSCLEIGDSSVIPFFARWTTEPGQYDPITCAHVITGLIKVIQGNTVH